MNKRYKIYNFDHGIDYPSRFRFGPFKIIINEEHCENLSKIPHDRTFTYSHDFSDGSFKKIIKEEPQIEGGWIETSLVEIRATDIKKSILYPNNKSDTLDDLCLILSFLTGRRVAHENNNLIFYNPQRHAGQIVHKGFLSRSSLSWDNIENIKKRRLGAQFYNLSLGCECENLIAQSAYINSAFNGIYDEWFEKNKFKKILKEKTNDNIVTKQSKKVINDRIRNLIDEYYKKDPIHPILKNDFEKRLNELWRPTATTQIRFFIESMGIVSFYNDQTLEQKQKRLEWLSKVRNSFAHTGDIPKDKAYNRTMRENISFSIISVVLRIVQYYFASEILKISDPYLTFAKNQIVEYFQKGTFCGKKIFDESFEEYMERTQKEWLKG